MVAAPVALCFLLRHAGSKSTTPEVLLGLKKSGFGAGRVVAPGGHVEAGESDAEAAVREVFEEVGIALDSDALVPLGTVHFEFPTSPELDMVSSLFAAAVSSQEPIPSAELDPFWVSVEELPLARMWPDAGHWLPRALERALSPRTEDPFNVRIVLAADDVNVDEVLWDQATERTR